MPWQGHTSAILALAVVGEGKTLLSASGGVDILDGQTGLARDVSIRQWDAGTGQQRSKIDALQAGVVAVAFSPDGRLAAVGPMGRIQDGVLLRGFDADVHLWNLAAGQERACSRGTARALSRLPFRAMGTRLLTGSADQTARLWDPSTGESLRTLEGHFGPVVAVALSRDGRKGLTANGPVVRVWDLQSGKETAQLSGHRDSVQVAALSPNGQLAAAAAGKGEEVLLWDVADGKILQRLTGHTDQVAALLFSPDSTRLLSAGADGSRLWQAATGQLLKRLEGAPVRSVALSPSGRQAYLGGPDGSLRVCDLPIGLTDLVESLLKPAAGDRQETLRELARMGGDARPAVATLLRLLRTAPIQARQDYLAALVKIGPPESADVSQLLPFLNDGAGSAARHYALDSLAALVPALRETDVKNAIEPLVYLFGNREPAIRRQAVLVLGQIGPPARSRALSGLVDLLHDSNEEVRAAALATLEKLGPPVRGDTLLLRSLLDDANPVIRRYALTSLTALGPEAKDAVLGLLNQFKSEKDADLRQQVLSALIKIQPRSRDVIETCTRALDEADRASLARRRPPWLTPDRQQRPCRRCCEPWTMPTPR